MCNSNFSTKMSYISSDSKKFSINGKVLPSQSKIKVSTESMSSSALTRGWAEARVLKPSILALDSLEFHEKRAKLRELGLAEAKERRVLKPNSLSEDFDDDDRFVAETAETETERVAVAALLSISVSVCVSLFSPFFFFFWTEKKRNVFGGLRPLAFFLKRVRSVDDVACMSGWVALLVFCLCFYPKCTARGISSLACNDGPSFVEVWQIVL